MNDHYDFDELRAMGCPNGLLMQYVCLTKAEIDRLRSYHERTQDEEVDKTKNGKARHE